MDILLKEAQALSLPCFDLLPAERGDRVVAYWRGIRSDFDEVVPEFIKTIIAWEHILSVEQELFNRLGLHGRGPLALYNVTTDDGAERLEPRTVSTGNLSDVVFKGSIPLTAKPAVSLPPLEALLLYGGPAVQEWLLAHRLQRWEYSDVACEVHNQYLRHHKPGLPLYMENPPFARIGGWHVMWPDDDFYIPREMRLMVWTFQESEPWYEVFLSPLKNYIIKERIT